MMGTVGAYEAKTHLAELLNRVDRGEVITITRHGVPVAMLVPPTGSAFRSPGEVIKDIRAYRKTLRLKGLSVREMIEEGRR